MVRIRVSLPATTVRRRDFASHANARASVLLPPSEESRTEEEDGVDGAKVQASAAAQALEHKPLRRKRPRVDWAAQRGRVDSREVEVIGCGHRGELGLPGTIANRYRTTPTARSIFSCGTSPCARREPASKSRFVIEATRNSPTKGADVSPHAVAQRTTSTVPTASGTSAFAAAISPATAPTTAPIASPPARPSRPAQPLYHA